ncbi:twin-arginine translocase subunit TatB [Erythrobacteraceae bacterium CFH 75059]|uniref:Sec-independent protein translocase protein TatB n=1 Tax=Qipengyuania thermophila TaxID=2509361 RepID=UPI00101F609D|nr:Sec-independent protein translocase protein TatB [Qipengyuania thermophila]TCD06208.1 twin-arginine translocase subunit TatB [Erythrobacteraceae bacterium CFH 75059]
MFDIGATELLVIVIVAVLAIGPKDMPLALRTAGRWIGKVRRVSGHFRAGLDAMIRDAELEEMEREWRERNAQIMRTHPDAADPALVRDTAAPLAPPQGGAPAGLSRTGVEPSGTAAAADLAQPSDAPAPRPD